MPPAGFKPAIPASELLQTHALDRSATADARNRNIYQYYAVSVDQIGM